MSGRHRSDEAPAPAPAPSDDDRFATLPSGVRICYRDDGPTDGPPLMLVAGLGLDLTLWPRSFVAGLMDQGFRVIRHDNRDVGRSSRVASPPPNALRLMLGRPRADGYLLRDMAADGIGLLDHLEIDRAHVAGMSMGAMIAQTMAATWPERVETLTSIISTTGDPRVGQPTLSTKLRLVRPPARTRDGSVRRHVKMMQHLAGPDFPIDVGVETADSAGAWDRAEADTDSIGAGTARQIQAIQASGDRTGQLGRITAPTLVIHGDHDLIVHPSGGRATADAIRAPASRRSPGWVTIWRRACSIGWSSWSPITSEKEQQHEQQLSPRQDRGRHWRRVGDRPRARRRTQRAWRPCRRVRRQRDGAQGDRRPVPG